jgi:hypothetical protein
VSDGIHQVRVVTDFQADGVAVFVVLRTGSDRQVLRPPNTWERLDPGGALPGPEPTLRLSDGHARALMEALLVFYNGTPDSNTQRADLMHERARRDKLEDHLMWALEMGLRPARPPVGGVGSTSAGIQGQSGR